MDGVGVQEPKERTRGNGQDWGRARQDKEGEEWGHSEPNSSSNIMLLLSEGGDCRF